AYTQALVDDPGSRQARLGLADLALERGAAGDPERAAEALGELDHVLPDPPDDVTALLYSAKLLGLKAQHAAGPAEQRIALDQALARLTRAASLEPKQV